MKNRFNAQYVAIELTNSARDSSTAKAMTRQQISAFGYDFCLMSIYVD